MTLSLWFDRLLVSEDDLPYRALAHLGIKPDSTAREVLDASFDMTPEDARDGRINAAWESLRSSRRRLVVDFFGYRLPEEPPPEPVSDPGLIPPLPWGALQAIADDVGSALDEIGEMDIPAVNAPPVLEVAQRPATTPSGDPEGE